MNVDERWMARALDLARDGEGLTRPNPPVGAVVVRNGVTVGEGFHHRAGTAHAEVLALQQAGDKARGATLYVTLEPCSTYGRTPPCVQAVLAAGIRRVVAAVRDPNPRHAGRGFAILKRRGVDVMEGVGRDEAAGLVAPFAKWITKGRPFITLKLAMSLDGRIADRNGRSQWISGPESRKRAHELRRRVDGIMVGAGTVLADDPVLTPRPSAGREPYRIIVDSRGRAPLNAVVYNDDAVDHTLVATTAACDKQMLGKLEDKGVHVLKLPGSAGHVSLPRLAEKLGRRGLLHVVCEGGGELAEGLVKARLVDEFWIFVAPVLIGGPAKGIVHGQGWPLNYAPRLRFVGWEHLGPDLLLRAVPE